MSRFSSKRLKGLVPYTPGEQPKDRVFIKLNTNEMPYPPSKKATEYASKESERLNLYPDPTCATLTAALAKELSVDSDCIIWGNGSDEILYFAFAAFCDELTPAAFPNITYGFYKVFAGLTSVPYTEIPLMSDFTVDVNDYIGVGKTVFIANPNAPSGIALPLCDIERIAESNPDNIVVIDEAYVDFGGESAVPLTKKYKNLLVVQTFSKSRAMAGARLGMGIGSPELISDLNTVKYSLNPYNINRMTMAAGLGTLEDSEYTRDCCQRIIKSRARLEDALLSMGFTFPKSSANFVFAKHPALSGEYIYKKLREKNILVRHFDGELIRDYNRITVGTEEQTEALIRALGEISEEKI